MNTKGTCDNQNESICKSDTCTESTLQSPPKPGLVSLLKQFLGQNMCRCLEVCALSLACFGERCNILLLLQLHISTQETTRPHLKSLLNSSPLDPWMSSTSSLYPISHIPDWVVLLLYPFSLEISLYEAWLGPSEHYTVFVFLMHFLLQIHDFSPYFTVIWNSFPFQQSQLLNEFKVWHFVFHGEVCEKCKPWLRDELENTEGTEPFPPARHSALNSTHCTLQDSALLN